MDVVLFLFGVIGLTHILVDSKITSPLRTWLRKPSVDFKACMQGCLQFWKFQWLIPALSSMVSCYQCCGFWVGLVLGWVLFGDLGRVLAAGGAGSFLSSLAATTMQYIENLTVLEYDHHHDFDDDEME